ncbi:Epidermal growth factor-like domain and EGF-like, laminin domain-containing protein [Strongyloides ratti]|uniref:Epidermal growth factor-like domain and EGF-like, laminin domain-containing protein n=1 Tax=Strongyloides ratti TaxID=34506 RepID=A0A090KR61_STRRB|nr:Epidermal growth factor-like domain and EGF-like, laminin domain-containing protein [Strongyloides ratti]CEF59864.1 Epidermal growth factor-like domain and EGF-like, laminin domain-containing protein [Strongyloides ratti]
MNNNISLISTNNDKNKEILNNNKNINLNFEENYNSDTIQNNINENVTQRSEVSRKMIYYTTTTIPFLSKKCLNNGTFVNGKCNCIYPYTGILCQDFACVHGLSTGPRYNKHSLFFSKMCICNDGWDGELCDVPTTEQCNERGNYVNGICQCQGLYFGENCQYVRNCLHGNLSHGRCLCESGWEGDYCGSIICRHGHPNLKNNSESCICPPRYAGIHCERCAQKGKHVTKYPECTIEIKSHTSEIYRKKNDHQMLHRMYVIGGSVAFLGFVVIVVFVRHWIHIKLNPPQEDIVALRSQYYHQQLEKLLLDKQAKEKAVNSENLSFDEKNDIPLIT